MLGCSTRCTQGDLKIYTAAQVRKTNCLCFRQGYLYVQNKKNLIGTQWVKHYCQYQAKTFNLVLIPYNQMQGKITTTESIRVVSCICKEEPVEKFRFVVTGEDTNNRVSLNS